MIVITNIMPKYSQFGHVTAFKIRLKNEDNDKAANGHVVVKASNITKTSSESKEGLGVKEVNLPPNADEEIDIPLETSVLIQPGQTHYIITISN
jgi:hypothetical protein